LRTGFKKTKKIEKGNRKAGIQKDRGSYPRGRPEKGKCLEKNTGGGGGEGCTDEGYITYMGENWALQERVLVSGKKRDGGPWETMKKKGINAEKKGGCHVKSHGKWGANPGLKKTGRGQQKGFPQKKSKKKPAQKKF